MDVMSNEELQAWVERISEESFGLPFRHRATFNRRLSTTGGRYFMKSHHIEINPHQLEANGREEVEKIIKHELCHYHLHLTEGATNTGIRILKCCCSRSGKPLLPVAAFGARA